MRILFVGENSIAPPLQQQLQREFPHARITESMWPDGIDSALGDGPIDVAIIDQALGWSSGRVASKKIKQRHPDCIVVLLTSTGQPEQMRVETSIDHWLNPSEEKGVLEKLLQSLRRDVHARGHIPRMTAARAHLAAIVECSEDAIISKDLNGVIMSWNSGAERIFGYDSDEAIGKPVTILIPADRRHEEDEILARIRRGERLDHFETIRVDRTGRRIHVSETISPIRGDRGQIVGASKIVRDISDKKRLENELKLRMQELASADHKKNEFLAMLAHELRNPLAPIRNAIEILRIAGPPDPILKQAREMIDRQVGNMVRMIDDLLDLSRIAMGKIQILKERTDLTDLVRTCVADHKASMETVGLSLQATLPKESLWTYGDPTRLSQVVSNVLQNAMKFTDPGGTVSVSLKKDNGYAVLSIRDTGIGIEPEMVDQIFNAFIQADHTIDRSRGGLGLGLALVKSLVELHGGQVRAVSGGLGQGTDMTVRLPLKSAPDPEDTSGTASPKASGRRILIIEDNADAAESLRLVLELQGHEANTANSGDQGIEIARQLRPEIVLCDIGLAGGMDGHAVARAFRADPELKDTFMIAVSGYGQQEDRQHSILAGFDVHLTKPVEVDELERTFARIKRGSR